MTIYDVLQEKGKKLKCSANGIVRLVSFTTESRDKVNKKPFCLWKLEEGKRINRKALFELNRARVSGEEEPKFELVNGIFEFVPTPKKKKAKKVA